MGVMKSTRAAVKDLTKQGYCRFVAIFTWTGQEDKVVLERFKPYIGHNLPPELGIDPATFQTYYLTGARTHFAIGYSNSGMGLAKFSASITYGTDVKANIYHAVEGWEIAEAAKAVAKSK